MGICDSFRPLHNLPADSTFRMGERDIHFPFQCPLRDEARKIIRGKERINLSSYSFRRVLGSLVFVLQGLQHNIAVMGGKNHAA